MRKKILAVLLCFAAVFALASCACGKDAAGIGIIGGADGPTAIYIT